MDDACYIAALRILNHRFNSEAELRRKLRTRKFPSEEIDAAIARLHRERWLDDTRFAMAFARTRAQKRLGPRRILRELEVAGIETDEAERAVAAAIDPERERQALTELRDKRAAALARRHGAEYLGTPEGRNKLTGYLLKQGYDAGLIYEALKEIRVVEHQSDS
jgi:regulatory protein